MYQSLNFYEQNGLPLKYIFFNRVSSRSNHEVARDNCIY